MLGMGKKSRQLVGLDIGSSSIKAVELKASKAGYELVSFGMETLAPDTVVDGAIMDAPQVANAISKIFDAQRIKTKNVATSVSGHSVIVKRVPLPLMTEDELYDRIPSEASQHIPFDIADVNLSYQLLESMDSQMDVPPTYWRKQGRRQWWWISMPLVCRTASKSTTSRMRGRRWRC